MSRYALVVGVSEYRKDHKLKNLPAATADLTAVSRVLADKGDFQVEALHNPTKYQFDSALENLFANKTTGDTILVYFSGHGLTDADSLRLYLATTDTDQELLNSSAVESALVSRLATETFASAKIIMLDCCFAGLAGSGLRGRSAGRASVKQLKANGTVLVTATDRTSEAFEDTKAPNRPALFTEAVVEGLSGGARDTDGDGWISVQDLVSYVHSVEKVRKHQTPQLYADGVTGSLPLVRDETVPASADEIPSIVCGVVQPEPAHDPSAPLDNKTWKRLLAYYAACLRREAGMDTWLDIRDESRFRIWPGGPEALFSGDGQPFTPEPELLSFMKRNSSANRSLHYGYPVIVDLDRKQPAFTPLITARLEELDDGIFELAEIRLDPFVLEELGLEPPEVEQLTRHFTTNFQHSNPEKLKTQIDQILTVLDINIRSEPDPSNLAEKLKTSPLVDGLQNLAVIYVSDDSPNTIKGLLKELEKHVDSAIPKLAGTALGALAQPDRGEVVPCETLVSPGPLNESQEAVIHSAMSRRITVTTGPPGTGKTALVTALNATAEASGQTVLDASTNHEAVNGVHDKSNAIADGMVIRTGKREIIDAEPDRLTELLKETKAPVGDPRLLAGKVRHLRAKIAAERRVLDDRRNTEADLLAILERLTVLRDSALPQTLPLLETADITKTALRARRSLRRWPSGTLARFLLKRSLKVSTVADRQHLTEMLELEIKRRELVAELNGLPDEHEVWTHLKSLDEQVQDASRKLIQARVSHNIHSGRALIKERIDNIRAGESSWKGFAKLLGHLPGWAVNSHSSGALPPNPGLFDLVIIDEAAQCSTPLVLALLMRAKRALIIGDPYQIQPVVKMDRSDDDLLRRRHKLGKEWMENRKLGYVGKSIYEAFAASTGEVSLLDEHFRCDPAIVDVPNRAVYDGRLAVLTSVRQLAVPATDKERAVQVIDHPGRVVGKQNRSEAERVLALIEELRTRHPKASIGVVSPFRDQVKFIKSKIPANEPPIKVGTAHTFQGDECDIIILSPVASEGVNPGTARWAASETNLWNVAITRAKSRLYVVCDRTWWSSRTSLLTQLISAAEGPHLDGPVSTLVDKLQFALADAGIETLGRDELVGGHLVQLVVPGKAKPRAIVLDAEETGSGHKFRQLFAKLDLIADAGYEPVRIPAWRALAESDTVAAELAG